MTSIDDSLDATTDATTDTSAVTSPGQLLRQAREAAQMSLQDAAQALHMTATKVRAIESDDYGKLNVDTYIRGYLRAYATLLKIDSAELISAYEVQAAERGILPRIDDAYLKKDNAKKPWGFMLVVLATFAILLLISVWFLGNRITTSPAPNINQLSAPISHTTTTEPAQAEHELSAETATSVAGADASTVVSETEGASTESSEAAVLKNQTSTALDQLQLTFTDECWLEVSDAQGDVLATELQRAGSKLLLQGRAPFQVKLGNASAASIMLNNKPVAVTTIGAATQVLTVTVGSN